MMRIRDAVRSVGSLMRHPLGRIDRRATLARYIRWQVGSRIVGAPVVMPFLERTHLLARTGMQGATGNIYVGLLEFAPMGFALHVLGPDDLFLDVGANVGVYTVLAAGACGTDVIAFEPASRAADDLAANVRINGLAGRVEVRRCAVGRSAGIVEITADRDSTNQVIPRTDPASGAVSGRREQVRVEALDDLEIVRDSELRRIVVKIDVEGYEVEVLEGARQLLRDPTLLGVLIEINGSGAAFGHSDQRILDLLAEAGLSEVIYDPIHRRLTTGSTREQMRLFVRDLPEAVRRVEAAPRIRLGIGLDL